MLYLAFVISRISSATRPRTPSLAHTIYLYISLRSLLIVATPYGICIYRIDSATRPTHTRCSTLQHIGTHYNTLQHSATLCSTLQHSVTLCSTLQRTATLYSATYCNTAATLCNILHDSARHTSPEVTHTATLCNTLQHTAAHCNTLQHSATLCNTLQHSATLCDTLQHSATLCKTYQPRTCLALAGET